MCRLCPRLVRTFPAPMEEPTSPHIPVFGQPGPIQAAGNPGAAHTGSGLYRRWGRHRRLTWVLSFSHQAPEERIDECRTSASGPDPVLQEESLMSQAQSTQHTGRAIGQPRRNAHRVQERPIIPRGHPYRVQHHRWKLPDPGHPPGYSLRVLDDGSAVARACRRRCLTPFRRWDRGLPWNPGGHRFHACLRRRLGVSRDRDGIQPGLNCTTTNRAIP